jgi:hypothetical protein
MFGAIDQGDIDVFKVFRWRVMNDCPARRRKRGEQENCG